MIATRRFNYNASLEFALTLSQEHQIPLIVIEEISTSHRFSNDRIATFMIQGMLENIASFKQANIRYIPWVETPLSGPMGLLKEISKKAKIVVTDEYPTYYPKKAVVAASKSINVNVLRFRWCNQCRGQKVPTTAHGFRRFVPSNFSRTPHTWPKFNPIPKEYDLVMEDAFNSIIEDSKLKLPPYEWLWRCLRAALR